MHNLMFLFRSIVSNLHAQSSVQEISLSSDFKDQSDRYFYYICSLAEIVFIVLA